MTFHILRNGSDYPRYTSVADKFFEFLPKYREFWKSESVQDIVLSYVNVIEIPGLEFDPNEYFQIGVKFPDTMGKLSQFETHLIFKPENEWGIGLDLKFRKMPFRTPGKTRFYLFANYYKKICDETQCKKEVEELHQYARLIFETGLTEKCKDLFEPKHSQ